MKINHPLIWFGVGVSVIVAIYFLLSSLSTVDQDLTLAEANYKKAETASTLVEREDGFNQSLQIYKKLEKDYSPTLGNGKLYFNIANIYFQLGQYPLAVAYYLRAQNLMPKNEKVEFNLKITQNKLGVQSVKKTSIFDRIFIFHNFSMPQKLQALFVLSTIAFILGSCFFWYPFHGLKTITFIVTVALLLLLLSLFYTYYLAPSVGVILKANELYQDAGTQYSKVLSSPLLPGTEVDVTGVSGKWLKIKTADGVVGYIPYDSILIV